MRIAASTLSKFQQWAKGNIIWIKKKRYPEQSTLGYRYLRVLLLCSGIMGFILEKYFNKA
ncbi:conserved protein of unknown function, might related with Transcriptional regulator, XRE family [Shewanella benthica]|uniref:Uncharacterized protein n=1 Tax=Shewanella benthica TaxID=43661 RepID=A0A330LYV9_9GAMM|nr:conserved protein of unknown function, might related with Transcriptional regulator, XRE family [Shewanella benthica]